MNRAEKRRQKKQAEKAAKNKNPLPSVSPTPDHQSLAVEQSLHLAVQHHTAGRLAEAETIYQQILQADANQPVALHLLGVLAHQVGKHEPAVDLISRAIAAKPDYDEAHNNLGLALQGLGKLEQAVESYQRALVLKPDYAEAHNNLGNALLALGKPEEATDSYHRAIAIKPDYIKAHNNLGLALREVGALEEAVESYRQAIAINPDYAEAHSNLGNALKGQGQLDLALASFHRALAINPNYAEAHNNLGLARFSSGNIEMAIACYHQALAINPEYAEGHNNLGLARQSSGKLEQAIQNYHDAIAIRPEYAQAHNNLGNALKELGRLDEAIAAYRQALRIDPDYEYAAVNLLHQLRHACVWPEVDALDTKVKELTKQAIRDGKNITISPFDSVTSNDNEGENLAVARSASQMIANQISGLRLDFKFPGRGASKPRITVGYLSSDFQNHATAHLMLSLFKLHNRNQFNVITFSYGPNDETAYRAKIIDDSDKYFDLQDADHAQAAQIIFDAGVDILIDLKGHTQNNRLEICALRPAPVQVSYLGFPGTTGADFLHYIITDRTVAPEDRAPYYSEQFVYLPDCYQVNDQQQKISDAALNRSDFGLPDTGFVFCSFNGTFKIEPVMFDIWMTVLKRTPDSVLWLYRSNDLAEPNLKREAQARGIDGDRLIFTGKLPKDQHLARYRLADLALDTRICGGHTTTSDALWAGVPVVTMMGGHFASRVSASLLKAVGMPELITQNLLDYETLAVRLSQAPAEMADLKAKLSRNRLSEPLFDTPRFVRNLESAYRTLWAQYVSGKPPARIVVAEE